MVLSEDAAADPALIELRELLTADTREQVVGLDGEVAELRSHLSDGERIADTLRPRLGELIRQSIVESREDMIEALYPIIGSLIARSVREAINDLARTLEAQRRRAFDVRRLGWRLRTAIGGGSAADIALREALPFVVSRVLLIHRETGLLLAQVSADGEPDEDADLMSALLTALRDFATDTLDTAGESLDSIEVGGYRVLVEADGRAVLAVVIEGTEPPAYRDVLRERLVMIDTTHGRDLRGFDGSLDRFADADVPLRMLVDSSETGEGRSARRKNRLPLIAGLAALLALIACNLFWTAGLTYGAINRAFFPTPTPTAAAPTVTMTALPTETPLPTPRPTLTLSPAPTVEPRSPVGRMTGSVYLQSAGGEGAERTGSSVGLGDIVEILESVLSDADASVGWHRIRAFDSEGEAVEGWVPMRWVDRLQD